VEYACSQVAIVERLLQEMLASIGQNILHPTRVSLKKKRGMFIRVPLASFVISHSFLLCLCHTYPGSCGRAHIAGGGISGAGGHRCCGGCSRHDGAYYGDFCSGGYCSVVEHCGASLCSQGGIGPCLEDR
jgi:hypothetical protein